jgi:GT2 family glycosyltransferase
MYVVMPCFNTEKEIHDLTEMAVESMRSAGDIKLIIVDNGSTFAPKALEKLADIYIRNETNLGYPKAVNQGLKKVESDVVCIANNDIRVPKGIFDLKNELTKYPKIGSLHFKMIDYDQPFDFGMRFSRLAKSDGVLHHFSLLKQKLSPKAVMMRTL